MTEEQKKAADDMRDAAKKAPCVDGRHIAVGPAAAGKPILEVLVNGTDADQRELCVRMFGEEETARVWAARE